MFNWDSRADTTCAQIKPFEWDAIRQDPSHPLNMQQAGVPTPSFTDGCSSISHAEALRANNTLKPKSTTASPKALADSNELVYGGTRLGQHMHGIGRWSLIEMLEHTKFIFIIVKLESQGYSWTQLVDLELHYRQGMRQQRELTSFLPRSCY